MELVAPSEPFFHEYVIVIPIMLYSVHLGYDGELDVIDIYSLDGIQLPMDEHVFQMIKLEQHLMKIKLIMPVGKKKK